MALQHNDKANMLNSFFSQCFDTKLPPLTPLALTDLQHLMNALKVSYVPKRRSVLIHLLQNIDVSKSNGPDKNSGRLLKATAHSIASSITKPFNVSINRIKLGCFLQTWKVSNVVPILVKTYTCITDLCETQGSSRFFSHQKVLSY